MCEGRCPIATLWRVIQRSNRYLSNTSVMSYHLLRGTWNAFVRLLDIDWGALYKCELCGPTPATVLCDGIDLGFRKDFLHYVSQDKGASEISKPHSNPIKGIPHKSRVYVPKKKGRDLLAQLVGGEMLCADDWETFRKNAPRALYTFCMLVRTGDNVIPDEHKPLLRQLTYNTSLHGIIQACPSHQLFKDLQSILQSRQLEVDTVRSVEQRLPLISQFLQATKEGTSSVPTAVVDLLRDMVQHITKVCIHICMITLRVN